MSSAVKLSDELVEAARAESAVWSRSMTEQVEHWARIGRAIERSGAFSQERVRSALRGETAYDALTSEERVAVLGEIDREVFQPRGDAALSRVLLDDSVAPTGIDASGRVVRIQRSGKTERIADVDRYLGEARRAARSRRGARK
jgi:hypothetical protein